MKTSCWTVTVVLLACERRRLVGVWRLSKDHILRSGMASLLAVAFATFWITSASAAPGLTVTAIQRDGAASVSVPDVMLRSKGVATAQVGTLVLQQELQDGVEIIVPTRTVITLKSSNGNTITLQPGSRFTVRHVGDDGESYTLDDGSVSFDVVKALNFFNVNYRKFLAIVKGTKFSVEVEPEKEIRFAVTQGTVVVEREERVLITAPGKEAKTSDLTVHDALQAGKQDKATYCLGVSGYLRKFNTYEGAEEFFRMQLEKDELSGDNARIVDSLLNLAIVLRDVAKPKLAIPLLERAGSLAGHATRPQIDSLTVLATIYTRERKLEQAREFLELALTLFSSADNALPLTCLACIQRAMGNTFSAEQRYDQAIIWYERSLQTIGPPISKEQYLSASDVHHSIAWAHADAGRPSAALKYAQKALGIRESMYDRRAHPELVSSYKLLSFIYRQLGDYREATNQTEKALQQLKRNEALLQFEAADAARIAQGWQAAIPYFDAALNAFMRLTSDDHGEEVARLQTRLFLAWTALGDEQKANYYIREAQATRDRLNARARSANRKEP